MNERGAKAVTECPVCHRQMTKGSRVSATFNWEGASITKRRYSYTERIWHEKQEIGTKGKTRIVCRECAEKAASMLGIERPEEVVE